MSSTSTTRTARYWPTEVPDVLTVGRHPDAMVRAEGEELSATGASFTLVTPQGAASVRASTRGRVQRQQRTRGGGLRAWRSGSRSTTVVAGLAAAPQVPGRLERIEAGQPFSVIVDYAHTPDSLEKAILAVKDVTEGRVIAVFGCGGDRDPDKRPLMGAAAALYADAAIITSDNPRSEDPVGIILQVEDGVRGTSLAYEVEVDRRRAIARAFEIAEAGDSVLIAGKGHEDYQIFADRTIHFDDREVAREELAALGFRAQSVPHPESVAGG